MMARRVVFARRVLMATGADAVSLELELRGMRIMAVGAVDVLRIHFAL
jgi:hypothetical protein